MSDLISRQAAIDAECEVCQIAPKRERGHNCNYYVHGCKEIECIRVLQSAQQWTPCSEKLPEVGQTVICQCRADILKLLKLDSGGDWYQDAEHAYMNEFVIAWMPLPPSFKEE